MTSLRVLKLRAADEYVQHKLFGVVVEFCGASLAELILYNSTIDALDGEQWRSALGLAADLPQSGLEECGTCSDFRCPP